MMLPALNPNADIRAITERLNRIIREFNRGEQDQFAPISATDTGAADVYVIAPVPGIKQYLVNQRFVFKVANANLTTTPTLAVNGLAAGTIKLANGTALAAGDLPSGGLVEVVVASTSPLVFHLQTPTKPTATPAYVDAGAIRQVASTIVSAAATGTTTIPSDNTIPQSGEGDQYMSLAITPKSATSKLKITVTWLGTNSAGSGTIAAALFQDSIANALAVGMATFSAGFVVCISYTYIMTSGTTSATTFKVRAGANVAGTTTFNGSAGTRLYGGVEASSIVIEEIGA